MHITQFLISIVGLLNVASALVVVGDVHKDDVNTVLEHMREMARQSDDFSISHIVGNDSIQAFHDYFYGQLVTSETDINDVNGTVNDDIQRRSLLDCDEKGPRINISKLKQHKIAICSTGAGLVGVGNGVIGVLINKIGCKRGNDAEFSDVCSQFVTIFVSGTSAGTVSGFSGWCTGAVDALSDECARGGTYTGGGDGIGERSNVNIKDIPTKNAGCDQISGVTTCEVINP